MEILVIAIGLRAAPSEITYAIYDVDAKAVVDIDQIVVPTAMEWPAALKYVRSNLLDILRECEVRCAGIRLAESNAKTQNISRLHLEGVIQEAFASSDLNGYYVGAIPTMAARLGVPRGDMRGIIGGINRFEVEGWDKLSEKEREALLAAMGSLRV